MACFQPTAGKKVDIVQSSGNRFRVRPIAQARFRQPGVFKTHERTIAGAKQKSRVNQRVEQRSAGGCIEAPQSARLRLGQSEAWHLEKFALDATEYVFGGFRMLCHH
jgi:hypothetical protein